MDLEPVAVTDERRMGSRAAAQAAEDPVERSAVDGVLQRETHVDDPGHFSGVALGGLHRDEPLQQGVAVVLVGEDEGAPTGGDDVARHLHTERRLAVPGRTAEQDELTGTEAARQEGVESREAGRPHARPGREAAAQDVVRLVEQGVERTQGSRVTRTGWSDHAQIAPQRTPAPGRFGECPDVRGRFRRTSSRGTRRCPRSRPRARRRTP